MEIGILGLPKAGKTTLFNLLTGSRHETGKFSAAGEAHVAVAKVPDDRLARLRDLYNPKKYIPATVQYVDMPGLRPVDGRESLDLAELRNSTALMHVVRAFADDEILHPEGSVDPARDIASLDLELILADHELVERRIQRLDKATKRGLSPEEQRERKLLDEVVRPALEEETPLRQIELEPEDERRLRGFQLLSAKPLLVVVNVDESAVADAALEELGIEPAPGAHAIAVSAPIEEEISRLDPEEQREFLSDLGLEEPSLDRVVRAGYELLGLISFFTVGEDEVRAWTIRRGEVAREAAGEIHSDIQRGFIRAEVVRWDDLLRLGDLAACRDQALLRLEGKEYVVQDGDVVHFRSNV